MGAIPGSVRVTGFIAPSDSTDTYGTHNEIYGIGGYRSVATISARDSIPASRRLEGMLVKTLSDGRIYTLTGGINNSNWAELTVGAADDPFEPLSVIVSSGTSEIIDTNLASIIKTIEYSLYIKSTSAYMNCDVKLTNKNSVDVDYTIFNLVGDPISFDIDIRVSGENISFSLNNKELLDLQVIASKHVLYNI